MIIEKIPVTKLQPAKYNPRKDLQPGDPEFEKLRRSVEEFGYVEPIIWNKRTGVVIGGHQRLKVLQHLGYTEVDCVVLDLDERLLCREDCKGLCDKCGADLNEGPCSCKAEIDPRLAVLGQLLEND